MMLMLTDLKRHKHKLTKEIYDHLLKIVNMMQEETISLDGWRLDEIPIRHIYMFYNPDLKQGFDIEYNPEKNLFIPLYYDDDKEPDSKRNTYEAVTICEAIELYRL
ncbi:hypothetical protein NHG34_02090 [Aerococcaceae bacterium NML190938]|nr:hypothetical protein [Aerococcaceae bacterium NML190938]